MAKFEVKGMNEYIAQLQRVGRATEEVVGAAVYAMAGVVADKVRANLQALPTVTNEENKETYKKGYSKLSDIEKEGLLDGFGISHLQDDNGFKNVKLGFDGYNGVKTRKYPSGQPNALIARVTESGSPYREKTPFIRTAVSSARSSALKVGKAAADEKLEQVTE